MSHRLGDLSDEEDNNEQGGMSDEGLERKIARLRRECEEVKNEVDRRRQERQAKGAAGAEVADEDEAVSLGKMLESFELSHRSPSGGSAERLTKALAADSGQPKSQHQPSQISDDGATYTVTYAPAYQADHDDAKVAALESRLTALERSLGITATAIPALDAKGIPVAVLPTIETLQRQMSVLLESTPSSLDNISRRVRTLTAEAERLEEARKAAKVARDELRNASGEVDKSAADIEDQEQIAKINALYGALPTIENLAPLLPALLDRLRSLRTIHADAGKAHESMEQAMKRQEEMAADIKRWREGLEKVEAAVKESETTIGGNVKVVEGWVKELEERVAKLGA